MAPETFNFKLQQGDSFYQAFILNLDSGAAEDLTGYTAKSQMKASYAGAVVLEFSCAITPLTGTIELTSTAAQTAALTPGKYIYDLQISNALLDVRTIAKGSVTVLPEVTK